MPPPIPVFPQQRGTQTRQTSHSSNPLRAIEGQLNEAGNIASQTADALGRARADESLLINSLSERHKERIFDLSQKLKSPKKFHQDSSSYLEGMGTTLSDVGLSKSGQANVMGKVQRYITNQYQQKQKRLTSDITGVQKKTMLSYLSGQVNDLFLSTSQDIKGRSVEIKNETIKHLAGTYEMPPELAEEVWHHRVAQAQQELPANLMEELMTDGQFNPASIGMMRIMNVHAAEKFDQLEVAFQSGDEILLSEAINDIRNFYPFEDGLTTGFRDLDDSSYKKSLVSKFESNINAFAHRAQNNHVSLAAKSLGQNIPVFSLPTDDSERANVNLGNIKNTFNYRKTWIASLPSEYNYLRERPISVAENNDINAMLKAASGHTGAIVDAVYPVYGPGVKINGRIGALLRLKDVDGESYQAAVNRYQSSTFREADFEKLIVENEGPQKNSGYYKSTIHPRRITSDLPNGDEVFRVVAAASHFLEDNPNKDEAMTILGRLGGGGLAQTGGGNVTLAPASDPGNSQVFIDLFSESRGVQMLDTVVTVQGRTYNHKMYAIPYSFQKGRDAKYYQDRGMHVVGRANAKVPDSYLIYVPAALAPGEAARYMANPKAELNYASWTGGYTGDDGGSAWSFWDLATPASAGLGAATQHRLSLDEDVYTSRFNKKQLMSIVLDAEGIERVVPFKLRYQSGIWKFEGAGNYYPDAPQGPTYER